MSVVEIRAGVVIRVEDVSKRGLGRNWTVGNQTWDEGDKIHIIPLIGTGPMLVI